MCVPMFRTFTSISNSVGAQVFSPCIEVIVHPSVLRMAAVVKSDGVSEYFEEDSLWDSFAVNFFEFLENVAIHRRCSIIYIHNLLLVNLGVHNKI